MRIHVAGHIGGFHNTLCRRLQLGLGHREAQLVGEAADHIGGRGAKLLEVNPDRRGAGQRLVARGDQMCR